MSSDKTPVEGTHVSANKHPISGGISAGSIEAGGYFPNLGRGAEVAHSGLCALHPATAGVGASVPPSSGYAGVRKASEGGGDSVS
jgi:hypothetical protein